MTEEEIKVVKNLARFKAGDKIDYKEIKRIEEFLKLYVDSRTRIDISCSSCVRTKYNIFKDWANSLVIEEVVIEKEEEKEEDEFARAVKEVEEFSSSDKCERCGYLLDKNQKKFCSKSCRYNNKKRK